MLSYHDRCAYSAIVDRPVYDWPNDTRLAVYIAINVEHFPFGEGEGGQLIPGEPMPNVRAWTWRDYGNRVGVWNLLALCEELDLPITVNLNSEIYDYCPRVVEPFRDRGDEIVAQPSSNTRAPNLRDGLPPTSPSPASRRICSRKPAMSIPWTGTMTTSPIGWTPGPESCSTSPTRPRPTIRR
jgi:hypothetical protein